MSGLGMALFISRSTILVMDLQVFPHQSIIVWAILNVCPWLGTFCVDKCCHSNGHSSVLSLD